MDAVALVRHAQAADTHWRKLYDAVALTRYALLGLVGLGTLLWRDGLVTALLPLPLIAVVCGVGWRTTFLSLRNPRGGDRHHGGGEGSGRPDARGRVRTGGRACRLQDANIIVFDVADSPFVGSGTEIGRWALPPIDVSRSRERNRDGTRQPATFPIRELHDDLIRVARSRLGLSDIEVTKRIYVRGDVLRTVGVVPSRPLPPPARLDTSWVDLGSDAPGEQARTYVCPAKSLVGGQIVVTLFARYPGPGHSALRVRRLRSAARPARLRARHRVLRPVRGGSEPASWALDHLGPRPRGVAHLRCRTVPALEPGMDLAEAHEERTLHHYEALQEGRRYDYGALFSARELAATTNIDSYFEVADVRDCLLRLQRGVIDSWSRSSRTRASTRPR